MKQQDLPKANANCAICGKPYYRCERCIKLGMQGLQHWKLHCDTPNCYQIYFVLENYKAGHLDAEQAILELNSLNADIASMVVSDKYRAIYDDVVAINAQLHETIPQTTKKTTKKSV